jgi:predicted SprT family Zn-dependent metalloprotease
METKTLTTAELKIWFNEFNKEYFGNKLPMPTLKIKKCTSYLGKCFPSRKLIIMSVFYNRSKHDFRETFLHEMIHLYNWLYDSRYIGHGLPFKRKAKEINHKGGWNIARCSAVPNDVKEKATAKTIKDVYALAINTHQHRGKLHFSIISNSAFESGRYKSTLDYYTKQGWDISVYKTSTKHYPTAKVCRTRIYGNYLRIEDIKKDIECKKLTPIA